MRHLMFLWSESNTVVNINQMFGSIFIHLEDVFIDPW